MIVIKTDIILFCLLALVAYIRLSIAVKKKRFVSPIFDFECKNLAPFIQLV